MWSPLLLEVAYRVHGNNPSIIQCSSTAHAHLSLALQVAFGGCQCLCIHTKHRRPVYSLHRKLTGGIEYLKLASTTSHRVKVAACIRALKSPATSYSPKVTVYFLSLFIVFQGGPPTSLLYYYFLYIL